MSKNAIRLMFILIGCMLVALGAASAAVDVTSVAITPSSPDDTDTLKCTFTVVGSLASYSANVSWQKNGASHTSDNQQLSVQNNTATTTGSAGNIEPEDLESGDSWVCVVTATDGSATDSRSSSSVTIAETAKLVLTTLTAKCDPTCDDDDLDPDGAMDGNAGTIKEVKPGATLTLTARAKNDWPDGTDDHDIEDIELTCTLEDIGEEDEQEESIDFGDLEPDESSDKETMQFTIAKDAEDGESYSIDCNLAGDDQGGENYDIDFDMSIDVEKESHDVIFSEADISPATVSCNRKVTISYMVKNIGAKDEDDVEVVIKSDALDIFKSERISSLDSGDYDDEDTEFSAKPQFTIDSKVKSGAYPIRLEVFFDDGDDSNIEDVQLVVADCVKEPEVVTPPKNESREVVEIITQPPTQQPGTQLPPPVTVVEEPAETTRERWIIIGLAAGVIVLIGLLIWMVSLLLKK